MKILYSIHLEALWLCQLTKAPFISLNTTPLNNRGELLSVGSSFSSLQPSCLENKPQTIRSDSQAFLAGSTKNLKPQSVITGIILVVIGFIFEAGLSASACAHIKTRVS